MRGLYAARRRALTAALTQRFGDRVALELVAGGMHLLARFPDEAEDSALARRAAAAGLAPTALSSLALAHDCGGGLLLGFANLPEDTAQAAVAKLASAIDTGAAG